MNNITTNCNLFAKVVMILLFINSSLLYSQNYESGKGKAIIYFGSKTPVVVRLDTVLIKQTKEPILLNEGKHVIRAWAPTKQFFTDTIIVKEGRTSFATRTLKNSENYNEYLRKLWEYRCVRGTLAFVPIGLTVTYSMTLLNKYNQNKSKMNEHLNNMKAAVNNYNYAIAQSKLDKAKKYYQDEKENYEEYRNKNNQLTKYASVIISTAAATSIVLLYFSTFVKKPYYSETPLLTLKGFTVLPDADKICSVGLLLNMNR